MTTLRKLQRLREALLILHKSLLNYQKRILTSTRGPVESPRVFFALAVNDRSFTWLRMLSSLIVSIDIILDSDQGLNTQTNKNLMHYVAELLSTKGNGRFSKHYRQALHSDPAVTLAHAQVMKILKKS